MNGFPCPQCHTPCRVGVPACPGCGLRLVGPDAARLWEVHQQIDRLRAEADRLLAVLASPGTPSPAYAAAPPPYGVEPYPVSRRAGDARPRRGLSGQQLLLGLGALLLLSAAAFFLLVAWMLVGLVGQAAIMLALTVTAIAGAALAARRRLPAAAETAAVLASGLVLIDLAGAHARGLAGLDGVPALHYWTLTLPGAALVLLLADQLVPRTAAGRPVRPLTTYRPVAALLLALTPWLALAWADPHGLALPLGLLVVGLADAAAAAGLWWLEPTSGRRGAPVSAGIALVGAAVATLAHVASGLALGYDLDRASADRFAAGGLLMLLPAALAVLSARTTTSGARRAAPAAAVSLAFAALPIPFLTAPPAVFAIVAVLLAAALGAGLVSALGTRTPTGTAWRRSLLTAGAAAQPLLVVGTEWRAHEDGAYPLALLVVPSLAWLATGLVGAVHTRRPRWVAGAHVAAAATLARLVADQGPTWWTGVALAGFVGCVLLAVLAARHDDGPAAPFWRRTEEIGVIAGSGYAAAALGAALQVDTHVAQTFAAACFVVGLATLVYAALPGRLAFAYLGSLAISAGTDALAADAGIDTIEVYTLPLALLLAGVGLVQWRRDHGLPTFLTMAPATSVLLVPSTLAAISTGETLRLTLVSAAAVAVLLVGLAQRWKAPVTLGTLVLAVVALTQGGPYVAYLPGWLTLGVAGALLVAVGVSWEQAVLTGRRTTVWFSSLK